MFHACVNHPYVFSVGATVGPQSQVKSVAASQVRHCQHRHLRRAPLCLSSGQQASAAWRTDTRRQARCLSSRCPVGVQSAEQVRQMSTLARWQALLPMQAHIDRSIFANLRNAAYVGVVGWMSIDPGKLSQADLGAKHQMSCVKKTSTLGKT